MLKEFRTVLPYVREFRHYYLLGFIFLAVTDIGQLYIPQLTQSIIDTMTAGSFSHRDVLMPALLMVGVAAAIALGRFGWRFFIHGASRRIERNLRKRYFDHLLVLAPDFFRTRTTGDLMARATNDMNQVRVATGMAFVAFLDGAVMLVAILILIFTRYPQVAFYTVIPLPFVTAMVLFFGRAIGGLFRRVQEGFSHLSELAQESFSGVRVIKTFGQEAATLGKFREANEEYEDRNMALVRIWGAMFPIVGFLSGVTVLILLYFGGRAVATGTLTAGQFVAMNAYLGMLIWPMMGAGFTVNMLQRGGAALRRINEILNAEPSIRNRDGAEDLKELGDIAFEGVSFSYEDGKVDALKDIDLVIPRGTTLGILGKTGSGKTTMIGLMARLQDPTSGRITIGGTDLRDIDLHSLRRTVTLVPQQTFLFSSSIRDNISYGDPDLSDEHLARAADVSTISRDFREFNEGWETEVGEKGVTLSGGQKQRIAIARAVVLDPPVLVFDDALSAVDTASEEKILTEFLAEREGKTNVVISHRVSTLDHADEVIVLDGGKIIQRGSPATLKEVPGLYRDIYELQELQEGVRE